MKAIRARFPGKCRACGSTHTAGCTVYWQKGEKGVLCPFCYTKPQNAPPGPVSPQAPYVAPPAAPEAPVNGNDYMTTFEDYEAFLDAADKPASGCCSSRSNPASDRWDYNAGYAGAMKLARFGWPEGAARVRALAGSIGAVVGSKMIMPTTEYDMAGHWVDIGRYFMGVPDCMVNLVDVEREGMGRIVKVVVSGFVSAMVDAKIIETRGAAVCALVDALEASGRQCEVWADFTGSNHGDAHLTAAVVVKRAQDILDLDRMAFVLAHPGSFRRVGFAVWEKNPETIRDRFGCGGESMGYYCSPPKRLGVRGDVELSAMSGNEKAWQSEAGATAWVMAELVKQGVEFAIE